MTEKEKIELEIRRALGQLRSLYLVMMNSYIKWSQIEIERHAVEFLSPVMARLETLADSLIKSGDCDE